MYISCNKELLKFSSKGMKQSDLYFGSSMKMNREVQKSEAGKCEAITAKQKFSEEAKRNSGNKRRKQLQKSTFKKAGFKGCNKKHQVRRERS